MKKTMQLNKSTEVGPVRWILGGLAAITLYFQTNLVDPFNSPKLWILFIVAAWLVGFIVSFRHIIFSNQELKFTFYLVAVFTSSAVVATIFSDFKYIAFFGDTQRRNGFISYLSLAIILLSTSIFMRLFNIERLYLMTFFIAALSAIYAFMQTIGKDFVKWNNPYNAIIGTVGNPNFAAAVMAVMGVIVFSTFFVKKFPFYYRISAALLSLGLLSLIYRSDARQGLLAYFLGTGIFSIIWLYGKNRRLGMTALSGGVLLFIFALLGMLQIGPLEKFLYKPSVSVRGYYWRAGLEMFKDHPFFGVGMDRYGAYFKEYREVGYPLTYGFDITSSNAHNTFIHLFATGGIFLGTSYLLLNIYILKRAFVGLKSLTGNNRLLIAGLFSAWIAFHAQSLVSIDNIGISIWGWVLGGAIIGLSVSSTASNVDDRKQFIGKQSDINLSRVFTSSIMALVAIIPVTFLYRGESYANKARVTINLEDENLRLLFKDLQFTVVNSPLTDPSYKLNSALQLVQSGFANEGIVVAKRILVHDPRNLDAINGLALTSEQLNRIPDAIFYREQMAKLDPWNAVNYLALGKNYKNQGDLVKSKEMLDKILSFASNDPIAEQAKTELAF